MALPATQGVSPIARETNAFAIDLYNELRRQPGNVFVSPFSIAMALSMAASGSAGQTEMEFAAVLHSPAGRLDHAAYSGLLSSLDDKSGRYTLDIANRLWGQRGLGFLRPFLETTRTQYGAQLEELDFQRDPDKSRRTINEWVERKTRGKIVDLLAPGTIDDITSLVLTNAIYFYGEWEHRFDTTRTHDVPFSTSPGSQVMVPMMFEEGEFAYARIPDAALLALPYAGRRLAMVILLPDSVDGLPGLEGRVESGELEEWLKEPISQAVRVYVPRFRLETTYWLNPALQSLGLRSAFGLPEADFSRMTGRRELSISVVVHKAFVDVNERGTEAAAATGTVLRSLGYADHPTPPTFLADHPFLFLIRDVKTGTILFLGRVANP